MTTFVEDWCDRAEAALDYGGVVADPAEALRVSLAAAEQNHGAALSFSMLTQALLIIIGIWDVVGFEFTVFEERAIMEMIAIKKGELTAAAGSVAVPT